MAKLHEILAVEGELEGVYKKILAEAQKTFGDKPVFFIGIEKVYQSFLEEAEHDIVPTEHHEMVTTVREKLDYMFDHAVRYFDAVLQKDSSNQKAIADIVVGAETLAEGVPATTLLGLESKLKMIREVLTNIPTLQSGVKWEPAEDLGKGVFRVTHPEETMRTRKKVKYVTVAEATKEHPAQIAQESEEEKIGKFTKTVWSGMITPARKADILGKLDKLARAVKQARQRANCVEVDNRTIGRSLADFVLSE